MIHALRAETRRLLGRRVTLVALLALLGLIALFQLQVNAQVTPPSATEVAQAQQDYDRYVRDWESNHEQWEAECVSAGGTQQECVTPRPEPSDWGLAPQSFGDVVPAALSFAVYLGGMVLFVVMASFIGAEVTTGSLANWLTFVPSRATVLASKLVVATVVSVLVGALVGLVTVASSVAVTALHGQPLTGLDQVVAMAGRGVAVAAVFGVAGFCIGLLTGSTGASVGVLLGGIFLVFVRSVLVYTSTWAQRLSPWSPEVNLTAILDGGTTYAVSGVPGSGGDGAGGFVEKTVGVAHGLGYWAVLLTALIAVTWLVFRRRDIT
jgi:ABC-2 type transport system permease protein